MLYNVGLVKDPVLINSVYEFVKGQNLDYPDYDQWAKKCADELRLEYKKAFAVTAKVRGVPIILGSIIAQRHKHDSSVLELKNGRVREGYRSQKIFRKLYSEVESYAKEHGYKKILLDVHEGMDDVVHVMEKMGFSIEAKENLYSSKQLELILTKDLSVRASGIVSMVSEVKKIIRLVESIRNKIKYILSSILSH